MAAEATVGAIELPENRYLDRELSWLAFNNRVLDLARDPQVPLLERAKFLAIFSSNLDEYFMVRVAGLKRRISAGVAVASNAGIPPRELHDRILTQAGELASAQAQVFADAIRPALAAEGIHILSWDELTDDEHEQLHTLFNERLFPVLTPLAVDPSHPFPYVSGLSLNLAVLLRHPRTDQRRFARVKMPSMLERFVQVGEQRFVPLEDIVAHHLDVLFAGMEVLEWTTFRVTRNEVLDVEEDEAENLLHALEHEILRRNVGRPPVRLEVEERIAPQVLDILIDELDVHPDEVFHLPAPLDLTGLQVLEKIDRDDLRYPGFLPQTHPKLARVEADNPRETFATLRKRDVLVHHPYDSFATSVQRFVQHAAADPKVLAIKQTLYRTSGNSPIVDALADAAKAGKEVLVVVEIKAQFDEKRNIKWARKLERAGCHVVYGVLGLKTHAKLCLVVREDDDGLRHYTHIGTGNYNHRTARQYEDFGLLTSDPEVGADVAKLFNRLSGLTREREYRRLLVAPEGVRPGLVNLIDREIEHHQAGRPAGIRIKVNALVEETVIDALYRASMAGVSVDIWVRGICALRPGVPGLSENIRVRSVLGRFLEHSRLYCFANGGDPHVMLGSCDLMHRNLERRIEVLVSLLNAKHQHQIRELFDLAFDPNQASWWLVDDTWTRHSTDADGVALPDVQQHLMSQVGRRRTKEH